MLNTLLATKFYRPRWDDGLVARPQLVARLNDALRRKVTLVAAPAGFGKTMLVSEWLATFDSPTADPESSGQRPYTCWLALDVGDNDPLHFFAHFMAALRGIAPALGQLADLLLQAPQLPTIETLMTPLINELSRSDRTVILVLDDYHAIENPAIHETLAFLIEHLPPALHLLLTTRADPPWRLARLRARHQLGELRAADLRFQPDEATDFLTRVMQLPLSPADVLALEGHTEGWIAGLQMAALSMQGRDDLAGFIHSFTGSNRYIFDYLTDEVIEQQPAHLRDFLLRTSLLERLCAPLCDALYSESIPASLAEQSTRSATPDSQTILEQLEAANLFLLPLDDQRHWYRYHPLFAEVLQHRLRRTASAQLPHLYQRASLWCEQASLWDEAITYALLGQNFEQAARLLATIGLGMVVETRIGKLLRWIAQLPVPVRTIEPRLTIAYAWALLWAGQLEAVEPLLQVMETVPAPPSFVVAHCAALRAFRASLLGDLTGTLDWAQAALKATEQSPVPPTDATLIQIARGSALIALADSHRLRGDLAAATTAYEAAIPLNLQLKNLFAALGGIWSLGYSAQAHGQLQQATTLYRHGLQLAQAFQAAQGRGEALVTHFIQLQLGSVLYQQNQLDEAAPHLERAVHLYALSGVMDLVPAYGLLARLHLARGRREEAIALLPKLSTGQPAGLQPLANAHAAAERIRLLLLLDQDQPDAPNLRAQLHGWIAERQLQVDDALPYAREFEYAMLARALLALDEAATAYCLLLRLIHQAELGQRNGDLLEYWALAALALRAQGEVAQARITLQRALLLAQCDPLAQSYVRLFVEAGPAMRTLLAALRTWLFSQPRSAEGQTTLTYINYLLSAFPSSQAADTPAQPSATAKATAQRLIEPLTGREREVLSLLDQGLTNQAIAANLIISAATAKRHVANIFAKLDVTNRTQAIRRARELHLL